MSDPAELLRAAALTYEAKSKEYGDNYRQLGHVMVALFPGGLHIRSADDWNRLHLFLLKMVKLTRYQQNWERGGHADSTHDDIVYGAMLAAIDQEIADDPR